MWLGDIQPHCLGSFSVWLGTLQLHGLRFFLQMVENVQLLLLENLSLCVTESFAVCLKNRLPYGYGIFPLYFRDIAHLFVECYSAYSNNLSPFAMGNVLIFHPSFFKVLLKFQNQERSILPLLVRKCLKYSFEIVPLVTGKSSTTFPLFFGDKWLKIV
jgi:hypothetical protein